MKLDWQSKEGNLQALTEDGWQYVIIDRGNNFTVMELYYGTAEYRMPTLEEAKIEAERIYARRKL